MIHDEAMAGTLLSSGAAAMWGCRGAQRLVENLWPSALLVFHQFPSVFLLWMCYFFNLPTRVSFADRAFGSLVGVLCRARQTVPPGKPDNANIVQIITTFAAPKCIVHYPYG